MSTRKISTRGAVLFLGLASCAHAAPTPAPQAAPVPTVIASKPLPIASSAPSDPKAPRHVAPLPALPAADPTQIAIDGNNSFALRTDGRLFEWGIGWGQDPYRGRGLTPAPRLSNVAPAHLRVVSSRSTHACGIDTDDLVWCWGDNVSGAFGAAPRITLAGLIDFVLPTKIVDASGAALHAVRVVAGEYQTCAIGVDQGLSCWGSNGMGEVGAPSDPDRSTGTIRVLEGASDVAAGSFHTCAIATRGAQPEVSCWGSGSDGALGEGHLDGSLVPVAIDVRAHGARTPVRVAAGMDNTCILDEVGDVYCWGKNDRGQAGREPNATSTVTKIEGFSSRAIDLQAQGATVCALLESGDVACFGGNSGGELGDGTRDTNPHPRATTIALGGPAARVALGTGAACAVLASSNAEGGLVCWGSDWGLRGTGLEKRASGHPIGPTALPLRSAASAK